MRIVSELSMLADAARLRSVSIPVGNLEWMTLAYIAMGGNVPSAAGAPESTLAEAARELATVGRLVGRSRLYRTAPVSEIAQPDFVNAVLALETTLGPCGLLGQLMRIEEQFGRERPEGVRNGPRTLDLDILLYGDVVLEAAGLILPHPRMREREFVLRPLADLNGQLREPRTGRRVAELLQSLDSPRGDASRAVVAFSSEQWSAGGSDAAGGRPVH